MNGLVVFPALLMIKCVMHQLPPPMMSTAFLHPVLDVLEAQGCDQETLACQLQIDPFQLREPATMVPASRVYWFLAWATKRTGDQWLCARVGQRMAKGAWSPINPLLASCRTLSEFFRRFSLAAAVSGGAAIYRLEIEGRNALWKLARPRGATREARYADAVAVGFFVELFKQSGDREEVWNDCIAITSDISLIPDDVLASANLVAGAKGVTLRFPSAWLDWTPAEVPLPPDRHEFVLPKIPVAELKERVSHVLTQNLSDPEFGLSGVADAIGMPEWKLQKALRREHTSVSKLRNDARLERARALLTSSGFGVSDIAAALGYTNPSNFSRAFRSRTGLSPMAYRERNTPPKGR